MASFKMVNFVVKVATKVVLFSPSEVGEWFGVLELELVQLNEHKIILRSDFWNFPKQLFFRMKFFYVLGWDQDMWFSYDEYKQVGEGVNSFNCEDDWGSYRSHEHTFFSHNNKNTYFWVKEP